MAYQLKYYKEIKANGHLWRLEIWQDTEEVLSAIEIGPVLQGLRLIVQGDQADVDTAIVKTSLEMQFVDAPDLDDSRKCGYWEDFYTSSSTEYRVLLFKDDVKEWSGYITPDSFAEDLCYHASVGIIARDNLGTLQDTTFDMSMQQNLDGKVYVWDLVERAISISTCALDCNIWQCNVPVVVGLDDIQSNDLLNQMVDVEAFADMDWWQALEKTLHSVGLVLRYVGANKLLLMTLRDMPMYGNQYWWDVPIKDVAFVSYGRRELVPGIKDVRETFDFDISTKDIIENVDSYVENQKSFVNCDYLYFSHVNSITVQPPFNAPTHGYKKPRLNQYIMPEYSNLIDVSAYKQLEGENSEEFGQWSDKSIIYFAVNALEDRPVVYSKNIYTQKGKIAIAFTIAKPISITVDQTSVLNTPIESSPEYGTNRYITYRIKFTDSSSLAVKYYEVSSKTWKTSNAQNLIELNANLYIYDKPDPQIIEITDIDSPGIGKVELELVNIRILPQLTLRVRKECFGLYMRIKDISIKVEVPEDANIVDKLTLTTKYSDKYSVRLNRTPELAINPTSASEVVYIPKAIVTKGNTQYYGAEQWVWPINGSSLPAFGISLSRLIHQQLLAYHFGPSNVLTGDLIDKNGEALDFATIWQWNEKPHFLISGSLNILTGQMEGATLREFVRYDHMWETWIENEDIEVDFAYTNISLWAHSSKTLDANSWGDDIPNWIFVLSDRYDSEKQAHEFRMSVMENLTGHTRVAIFHIDTAVVRITQKAAGDYGIDYGEDYS